MKATPNSRRVSTQAKRRPLCDAIVLSITVASAFAGSAYAQQASTSGDGASALDNVIVTGTRKAGMAVDDSPAPIQVVTAEALQESGSPDLMNQLAFQVPSFNAAQQGTDMTSATLVANMRALSPNHTLVLVNGKRRHFTSNVAVLGSYAGAASTDLSFIPTSAIASTEVLTDGAAALYGSDAIAGVINLITKKNFTGGSLRTNVSGYDAGGGFTTNHQGSFGVANDSGYFNVALESERRETINRYGSPYGAAACAADLAACKSTLDSGTTESGFVSSTNIGRPNATMLANGYPTWYLKNEANLVNHWWYPYNSHQGDSPEVKRDIAFLSGGFFLENGAEVYATGSFGKKETKSTQSYRRPSQDGGVDLNGDGDRNDQVNGVWEADVNKYAYGFNPNIESKETDWSLSSGITGELSGWNYDLSTVYGKNVMDIYNTDSMNFTLWNTTGASPENFYVGQFEATQWTTALDVSREFDWGLVLPVTFAAGLEYREDTYAIGAGDVASYTGAGSAAFPGYSPAVAGESERNAKSAFVNLILNPTENWLVDVAGRYEKYSDFGSKAVGKLTTRYDFTDSFAVRGTVSTGFRAPTMGEQYYTAIQVGPTAATATLAAANVGSGLKPETSKNLSLGFVFRPLDNLTTTLDFYRIEIEDRIRLSSTINYSTSQSESTLTGRTTGTFNPLAPDPADTNRDGIYDDAYNATLGAALVAGGFLGAIDPTAPGGSFDSSARANIGLNFFGNAIDTKTTGVDLVTTLNNSFDWGRIDWTLAANYNKTEVTRVGTTPAEFGGLSYLSASGVEDLENNSPKWRLNLGATFHFSDKFSLIIRENIYGPQYSLGSVSSYNAYPQILETLNLVNIDGVNYYKAEIGTLATTNVEFSYKPTKSLKISVGADNLFDKYPNKTPEMIVAYNEERYAATGARNYILGSPIGFYGTRWFAKVGYDW